MVTVMTVTGPVEPSAFGATYAHEHLLGGPPAWSDDSRDDDLTVLSPQAAASELALFRMAGGGAMAEMSTRDYNRRPEQLQALSIQSKVNIVMTTGLHKNAYSLRLTENSSVDELTALYVREITAGVEETGVKAGVIKAATSLNRITDGEDKALRSAARAHLATGAPISTHTQAGTMGLEQIAILKGEGVDTSHVAIGHVDRKLEYDYHKSMLDKGVFLIYDQVSKEKYAPDQARVRLLIRLVAEGYGDRIMLGGDFGRASYLTSNGGGPGFTYILWRFLPWLIQDGMSVPAARALLVENPARFFAF